MRISLFKRKSIGLAARLNTFFLKLHSSIEVDLIMFSSVK